MTPVRVLVVEDSTTVRHRLVEALSADPDLRVVAEAGDGKQGIELCQRMRPDVVTIDMMMPVMTGAAAVEYIMAYCPTPILVVSASTNRGELFHTYDALAAGAIDVLDKPRGDEPEGEWDARFRAMVKLVSRIKAITHPRARIASAMTELASRRPAGPASRPAAPRADRGAPAAALVAIGGSTGAPAAIVDILGKLPRDFPAPILLVIHINEPFGSAFAEWLDGLSPLRVRYARHGEPLARLTDPVVLMAPPGVHLVLERGLLRLVEGPERHSCKPSVDVLFESIARDGAASGAVACLLSGMGRDGAAGMLAVRRGGGTTIAQDEATSVVFGMPREAIALGGATHVLPVAEIGPALLAATGRSGSPP